MLSESREKGQAAAQVQVYAWGGLDPPSRLVGTMYDQVASAGPSPGSEPQPLRVQQAVTPSAAGGNAEPASLALPAAVQETTAYQPEKPPRSSAGGQGRRCASQRPGHRDGPTRLGTKLQLQVAGGRRRAANGPMSSSVIKPSGGNTLEHSRSVRGWVASVEEMSCPF